MELDLSNAVKAVVDRLETADIVYFYQNFEHVGNEPNDYGISENEYEDAMKDLSNDAYCGCNGCIAQEAVDAAFPFIINDTLDHIVQGNKDNKTAPCCVVARRAWKYHVALLDISCGANNPQDLASIALGMKEDK